MAMASTRSRIVMIIFGVTPEDVRGALEARANSRARGRASARDHAHKQSSIIDFASYSSIPRVFVSAGSHPKSSNLLCWNCSLAFTGPPRFIATDCTIRGDVTEWSICGNFCSWACVAAFIREHCDTRHKKLALLSNLAVVRATVDGGDVCPVQRAPSRLRMSSYCGPGGISQHQYGEYVARADAGQLDEHEIHQCRSIDIAGCGRA